MALSPDIVARQRVNEFLRSRPSLTSNEWFIRYWTPPAVPQALPKALVDFAYHKLQAYSGLDIGRVQPSDRLVEDLAFPAVCWFDWGITLCEDVYVTFGLDISDHFDETQLVTFSDVMTCLHQQLAGHTDREQAS
jgi:hypothetical protein